MAMEALPEALAQELEEIKSDLQYIKEHMIDVDLILTEEERGLLGKAREEYSKGKTISLKELERELKNNV